MDNPDLLASSAYRMTPLCCKMQASMLAKTESRLAVFEIEIVELKSVRWYVKKADSLNSWVEDADGDCSVDILGR